MNFANPEKNVEALGLTPGMAVADFGSGSGQYSLFLARAVGASGRVYAIDVQKDLLARLADVARDNKIRNIECLWGDLERPGGSKLAKESVAAVVVSNLLFQVDNQEAIAKEVSRVLTIGGKVLIVDWRDSFGNLGPNPSQIVKLETAKQIFIDNGFSLVREFSAGEHHYGLILEKIKNLD